MSADTDVGLQTKGRRSTPLTNQRGGCDLPRPQRARRLGAKRMSLFIASLIRRRAASLTSCQTRFYGQLVDFSAAINSPDPPPRQVPGDCGGSRQTWAGGTSSPARCTLKAAAGSSRRIIACELTSCNASTGRRVDRANPRGDDDRLVRQPQDQGTPASLGYLGS